MINAKWYPEISLSPYHPANEYDFHPHLISQQANTLNFISRSLSAYILVKQVIPLSRHGKNHFLLAPIFLYYQDKNNI